MIRMAVSDAPGDAQSAAAAMPDVEDCRCWSRRCGSHADCARGQVADALTAILLYAAAIRQWSAGDGAAQAEIAGAAQEIVANAGRVWVVLENAAPVAGTAGGEQR